MLVPASGGDLAGAGRGEALLAEAAQGGLDDRLAGALPAVLIACHRTSPLIQSND